MKQGRASRDVMESWKRDPYPYAKNVKAVSQLGTSVGNHVTGKGRILNSTIRDLDAGRGFTSPLGMRGTPGVGVNQNMYPKGSQGRR